MAVETIYRSTLDLTMTFTDRKAADAHDLTLRVAERITQDLALNFPELGEKLGEDIGIYLAKNRVIYAAALKNNPDALDNLKAGAQPE